jgi:S1-C subfamily serine protease
MIALTHVLYGWLTFAVAPVPPEPPPDPLDKGYLGILLRVDSVVISEVQPGLPAAHAGLRGNDTIIRIGPCFPKTDQEVIAQVCTYRPGALVEIEVQRGNERKVFRVKLTARSGKADPPRLPGYPPSPDD